MKKEITTVFLTLATALGFAQDAAPNAVQLEVKPAFPSLEIKAAPTKSFGYVSLRVSETQLPQNIENVLPGLGLGYRLASGSSAIDVSASYNRREANVDAGKEVNYSYTLPKANYLYYVTAQSNNSLYAGGGAAFGGVKKGDNEFHGLIPNLTLGYEMNRNAAWHSFVQFDVSQPVLATSISGDLPRAFAELSLGAGF